VLSGYGFLDIEGSLAISEKTPSCSAVIVEEAPKCWTVIAEKSPSCLVAEEALRRWAVAEVALS
jgi:hypothetical protein